MTHAKKHRWAKTYEAGEAELLAMLAAKNIAASRWTADMSEVFDAHVHAQNKTVWCAEGSIVFTVGADTVSLQAGDALNLPAYTMHNAVAGFMGCTCYENPPEQDNPPLPINSEKQ